jgi:hypothetical protein
VRILPDPVDLGAGVRSLVALASQKIADFLNLYNALDELRARIIRFPRALHLI